MKDGSDNGGVVVAIGLILILLLLIGGVGVYFVVGRSRWHWLCKPSELAWLKHKPGCRRNKPAHEAEVAVASRTTAS